jgi:hypothetical protein
MAAILTGVRSMVLICISFMTTNGDHFSCVFSHLDSSFEKALFSSFAYFFIESLSFGGV